MEKALLLVLLVLVRLFFAGTLCVSTDSCVNGHRKGYRFCATSM